MMPAERRSLADLPPPSADIFPLRPPWCPVSARALTATLHIDPGLLGCWRMRGIGPRALPPEWTRGRSLTYQIDGVLDWLAARRGEPFDQVECWRQYLASIGLPADPIWARRLAESEGPTQGDVRFTPQGWRAYLASLIL